MIIIKVNGGLGNQLQQYALYEKFSSLGRTAKLDLSWFQRENKNRELELEYFPNVEYQACTKQEYQSIVGKEVGLGKYLNKLSQKTGFKEKPVYIENQMYDEGIFDLENKVLEGYWACEAYYADILSDLRAKLKFPFSNNPLNVEMLQQINSCNAISLHLRRGDYLEKENQEMFGGICTDAYYESAISYVCEKTENPHFFVFSDDPTYAEEIYGKTALDKYPDATFTIVDINHGKDSFFDMMLMSQCKHQICANSTFSFWGVRLCDTPKGIKIRPLKQKNHCDWYTPESMKRLWCGWTLIDEFGKIIE
ncbi:MAG: alpha-1,2-fucosyltransferase [Lachnospiraceae bacterium]|nr:alpha-1,2-fucosyltransferase [Lachnospiraceae bacterium]